MHDEMSLNLSILEKNILIFYNYPFIAPKWMPNSSKSILNWKITNFLSSKKIYCVYIVSEYYSSCNISLCYP